MTNSFSISPNGLEKFNQFRFSAIETVTARFYSAFAAEYERFGAPGRKACREDIEFHLQFLRPVLEFGLLQPYTDYLSWLGEVLASRNISSTHLPQSLTWLGEFFLETIPGPDGQVIAKALTIASTHLGLQREPMPVSTLGNNEVLEQHQSQLENALLQGDYRTAQTIINNLQDAGHSIIEIDVCLIQSALYNIGEKWQNNLVSVAQEHLATATAQTVMANAFTRINLPPANGQKALFACVEGNHHAVGLRMVSDAFELRGWDVQFLGANVPIRALLEQINTWKPDLLGLSIAFPHQLNAARETIKAIRERFGVGRPSVILGGLAINRFQPLAASLGGDAYAQDAASAFNYVHRTAD